MSSPVARPLAVLVVVLVVPEEVSAGCTRHDVRVTFNSFDVRQEVLTSGVSIGSSRLTVRER